jgi:PBP1b-binding outer membrane lipoprotein LpoB
MNPKLLIIVLLALFLANCQGKEDNRKEAIEDAQQKKTSANEIIRPVSIEKLQLPMIPLKNTILFYKIMRFGITQITEKI